MNPPLTTTLTAAPAVADDPAPRTTPAGRPLPTLRRRQPRWLLVGILAVTLGALGSVLLWTGVANTSTVLRVNQTLYRGHVITAQDLSPVNVGRLSGVDTVPADELPTLIGQQARTDMPGGSLLTREVIGGAELAPGTSVIGLRLEEGRVPLLRIEPGTSVLLVEVASAQSAGAAGEAPPRSFRAQVDRAMQASADQVATLVDVSVDRGDAEAVAQLAAEDRLVLVRSE